MFKLILILFISNTSIIETELTINEGLTKGECVDIILNYNKAFNAKANDSEFVCRQGELPLIE